ncbi:MAG: PilZ domain-containing protein [Verrucomicrobiales bacterium]|nr:hypothetical protein [Verrucomicrobiales bacterium]
MKDFDIKTIRKGRKIERVVVEYFVRFGVGGLHHVGLTMNLSSGGMFIKSRVVPSPGTKIEIEFALSDGYKALMGGMVVWIKDIPPEENDGLRARGMGVKTLSAPGEYQLFVEAQTREGCSN